MSSSQENSAGPMTLRPLPRNPTGIAVLAVSSVGIFVSLITVIFRLWARRLKRKPFDLGDYLIMTAWLLAFGDTIRKIVAFKWGVGLHLYQILATDPTHLMDAARITFAGYFIWTACVTCIKISILLVYNDFFYCLTWFVRCVRVTMVLCVLFAIGFFVGLCVQCTPFEMNYNPAVPGGHCGISRKGGFYVSGALNLLLDAILVTLPLPVVWTLNINGLKKLGVSAMFGLGTLIIVLVGYRFHLIRNEKTDDFIHDGEPPGIYTSLELYLGIISACLPLLSPPIAAMGSSISQSRLVSYLAAHSTVFSRSRSTITTSRDGSVEVIGVSYHHDKTGRDPHMISTHHDEESGPGSNDFMTVPTHWPPSQ